MKSNPTDKPADDLSQRHQELTGIREALQSTLDAIPPSSLLEIFNTPGSFEAVPDFQSFDLHRLLDRIEWSAQTGNESAIDNIRGIGVRIANFLSALAGSPNDEVQKRIDSSPSLFPEEHPDDKLNFVRDVILREFTDLVDKLHGYSFEEIQWLWRKMTENQEPVLWVDIDFEQFVERPGAGSLDKQLLIEDILQWCVGHRLMHVSRRAVRRVLARSFAWPIRISAIADGREKRTEKYVRTLHLGSDTRFKLTPTPGSGGTRKFCGGSRLEFVLHLVNELVVERRRGDGMSTSHKREYEADERIFQEPGGLPVDSGWNTQTHWRRKARLLPEPKIEHLGKWLDAGMARLAAQCDGKFEDVEWPSVIMNRTQYLNSAERGGTSEAALREIVKKGLEQLLTP